MIKTELNAKIASNAEVPACRDGAKLMLNRLDVAKAAKRERELAGGGGQWNTVCVALILSELLQETFIGRGLGLICLAKKRKPHNPPPK